MKRKTIWVLLQAMTLACLALFVAAGSASAWKVKVKNVTDFNDGSWVTAHVRIQKLFSRPDYCVFSLASGQEATCDTHGWCPSGVYLEIPANRHNNWNPLTEYRNCLGTTSTLDTTCCWDLEFVIDNDVNGHYYFYKN